jgi:hypothetical protein
MDATEKRAQIVLQVLMSQGALSGNDFRNIIFEASDKCNVPRPVGDALADTFANELTASLQFAFMEVRKGRDEASGNFFYCLVNVRADPIAEMSSKYTMVEVVMFKKILEKIILGDGIDVPVKRRGVVNLNSVLKLSDKSMNAHAVSILVDRLAADMWLWKVRVLFPSPLPRNFG